MIDYHKILLLPLLFHETTITTQKQGTSYRLKNILKELMNKNSDITIGAKSFQQEVQNKILAL